MNDKNYDWEICLAAAIFALAAGFLGMSAFQIMGSGIVGAGVAFLSIELYCRIKNRADDDDESDE